MKKYLLILLIVLPVLLTLLASCSYKKLPDTSEEAAKYMKQVNNYCNKNNLRVEGYLGKTILRGKDYNASHIGKEPIVYEWKVVNKASNEKFVIWVGPIMPEFPSLKPSVTLARERYTLKGKKVKELK